MFTERMGEIVYALANSRMAVCVCVCVCVFAVLKMPLKILKMDCQVGNFCGDLAVLFLD